MSVDEMTIALERLTRFKFPQARKPRVYKEILIKHSIEPKITLKNFSQFNIKDLDNLVEIIWNESIKNLGSLSPFSTQINDYLAWEDMELYNPKELLACSVDAPNDIKEKELIKYCRSLGYRTNNDISSCYLEYTKKYPLNIDGLLNVVGSNNNNSSHIQRLVEINKNISPTSTVECIAKQALRLRQEQPLGFPIECVVITEGITEEKLLPIFAKIQGFDFQKYGVKLLSAGGKNQVARMYNEFKNILNVPIFVLLDEDAKSIFDIISNILNKKDAIFLIPQGEFEDILPKNLILKALNKHYKLSNSVSREDITKEGSMCSILNNLWREKGFGSFNKSLFAEIIAENIENKDDLSETLIEIINRIKTLVQK